MQRSTQKFLLNEGSNLQNIQRRTKKKRECRVEVWTGTENKLTCLNCIRKRSLEDELKNKGFWTGNKHLKYWKVRRQGQYKELKIAPVYPQFC